MYQQINLVGNLGSDPELRFTPSGVPVASFNLAINKTWTNQDGQKQEKSTWFRVTVWRKLAEIVAENLTKGRQVLVIGEVDEARAYTDKDGNNRASLEVTATVVKFLGQKSDAPAAQPAQSAQSAQTTQSAQSAQTEKEEEDLPF